LVRIEPETAASKPATAEAESQNGAFAATQVAEMPPAKKQRQAKGIPEIGARALRLNFILTRRTVERVVTCFLNFALHVCRWRRGDSSRESADRVRNG